MRTGADLALRYRIAFDPILCADVRRILMRALCAFYRNRAERKNLPAGPTGASAVIQRFASALNLNPHFHVLCFDGVFDGTDFHYTGDPSRADIERLLALCIARIERLLVKRGIAVVDARDDPADQDPELAACLRSGVLDRERVHRRDRHRPRTRSAPQERLLARDRGYTLHADTAIPGFDSQRRAMLVRYLLRPPFAPSQLELTGDGRVSFRLAHPFENGTTHIVWTKDAFLARLAALVPRPRRHLITYHGVLAPNHTLRSRVIRTATHSESLPSAKKPRCRPRARASHEQLLLRAYGFCFRRCDHCGANKRVLAVINRHDVIAKILVALGLEPEPPPRAPPQATCGEFC